MNYEEILSERVRTIAPSGIRRFFDLASEIEGVISLGVGEPDFSTPWHICDAAIYSIENGKTHYTANQGLFELRREICNYHKRRFQMDYDPNDNVIVTVGGSEGIDIALRALIDPGDEVITMNPSYVAYTPGITLAGGVCVPVELKHEDDFKLLPEALEAAISEKTKVLLINFPSNPTGGVMSHEDYAKLVPIIRDHHLIVISDEIYAELTYDGKFASLAQFDEIKDQVIVINGFSKAFAMTGWRMGWACAPKDIMESMFKIHQYTMLCAPTAGQYAALEALRSNAASGYADVQKMVRAYDRRRRFLVKALGEIGLSCFEPLGAFYAFPSIAGTGLSSDAFCEALLYDQKVAAVPGTAFGQGGEGHIRLSYATSLDKIEEAVKRMDRFLEKQGK